MLRSSEPKKTVPSRAMAAFDQTELPVGWSQRRRPFGLSEYSAPPVLPAYRIPPGPIVTLPSHQLTSWPCAGLRVAR